MGGNPKEEKEGRAAIHASQIRKYSANNERAFADHFVSKEDLENESAARLKRKKQEESEMNAFSEAKQENDSASNAAAGMFAARAAAGVADAKATKKRPTFVMVNKKQKTNESVSIEAIAPEDATVQSAAPPTSAGVVAAPVAEAAPAGGGIGLGAYGSSSEESDDENVFS